MIKTVYICGDSFAVTDNEYGICWVDILSKEFDIKNLSKVCASNLDISKQVDIAINNNPDFIICLGTSSTRQDILFKNNVTSFSIHSINDTTKFSREQKKLLKAYTAEFFDLDTAIYLNKCIIENTLQKLVDSRIPFQFDQGGFEHSSFVGTNSSIAYFKKYKNYISEINLWDYEATRSYRPYYHITDPRVHQLIAEYYSNTVKYEISRK